jgi:hypothetical protein
MPHDPDTFKNLYPFPNKDAIFLYFQKQVLEGSLIVPQDRIADSKAWIKEQAQERYRTERIAYNESEEQAKKAYQKHQETEHNFQNLPESLKQKIHYQVWEDGHFGGYGKMENRYIDLVSLVVEAYEVGYSVGAHDNR